jgi:hypothetical protein
MKITAATVKRIAREKGISITMVSMSSRYGFLDVEMADLPLDMIDRNTRNPGQGNTVLEYTNQRKAYIGLVL